MIEMTTMVEEVMADELDQVIQNNKLVFVDCHAVWCGPCKVLSPMLEELEEKYGEKGLKVVKIDVDQNREFSMIHQIRGVPSVIIYLNGQQVVFDDGRGNKMDKLVGVQPMEIYEEIVEQLLAD